MNRRAVWLCAILSVPASAPLQAQEPPDSVRVDSLAVADSVALADSALVADSAAMADSILAQLADSVSADTVFYNLPRITDGVPDGFATGVWVWDRHAIMASGANTIAELFEEVPGLIALFGGDYGTPLSMAAFGRGGGGYRILVDGFELYPVDGSVADLQHVALAGVSQVRLDRSGGQMVVEVTSHRYDDGRSFSVVEAGTGDLDTNMFRGVYADPTALAGSVAVGLERVDTRGIGAARTEGGNRTGTWARYQYHFGDRGGLALDYRRVASQTQVPDYAPEASRKDVTLQASWRPVQSVVVHAVTGRSTIERQPASDESHTRVGGTRAQHAVSLGLEKSGAWARGSLRLFEGDVPNRRFAVAGGLTDARWGGFSGDWEGSSWQGEAASHLRTRAWIHPVPGVSLFGQYETGDYGFREGPVSDGPPPPPLLDDGGLPGVAVIQERESLRVGAMVSLWGITLGSAALYSYADEVAPLGLELDEGAPVAVGVHRNGYESMAVLPVPIMEGLTLEGSYQWWDEGGVYLPDQIYRGSFEFHRVFMDSGNLELWASLGVRGHDPMLTFAPSTADADGSIDQVPFFQSWYAHAQVRVVTVRLWLGMENMTFRRNLQTHPGRLLPYARSFFALRWDMWN